MKSTSAAILAKVSQSIQALPGVSLQKAEEGGRPNEPNLILSLNVQGQPATVLVDFKTSGYPRDVREALWQLSAYAEAAKTPSPVLMFVAPGLSEGARTLLEEQGISYADSGGSLYLRLPWALFFVERNAPQSLPRKAKTLYRGSRAQVLHVLLSGPERAWHVHALAEEAGVAPSTVHEVFRALEDEGWVLREGKGRDVVRRLCAAGNLLDAWAAAHTLKLYEAHSFYVWAQSPSQLRDKVAGALEEQSIPYAFTLSSGAELVAPFPVGSETQSILLPYGTLLPPLLEASGLKPADEGAM